jgi:hypothetical protein
MLRIQALKVNRQSVCMSSGAACLDYNGGSIAVPRQWTPMSPTPIVAAVLVPFVLWRVYQRVKRLMVRQKSQVWRHRTALIVFPLLIVALGIAALAHPLALVGMGAGAAGGVALGLIGLRRTVYEHTGGEFYYTPNARIGILVSMLFIGRLLYRGYEFYVGAAQPQDFASSPLTLMVFGVLAAYYTTYAAGLLRWRKAATL